MPEPSRGVHIRTAFYTVYDCPDWSLPEASPAPAASGAAPVRTMPSALAAAAGTVRGAMQRLLQATSNTSLTKPAAPATGRNWTASGDPVPRFDGPLSSVLACPPKHPRFTGRPAVPTRVDGPHAKLAENWTELFRTTANPASEFERRGHTDALTALFAAPDGGYTDFSPPSLAASPDHHFVFCVSDFLSAAECAWLTAECKSLLAPVSTQYAQRTRECDRALFRAPRLARELFARLAPHLTARETEGRVPLCFGQGGVWRPAGVNPVLKVMRYPDGGRFADHRDGPWIPREDQASVLTVLVYLTEEFAGGQTTFHGPCSPCPMLRGASTAINVVPVRGMAAVFNHDNVHCGNSVEAGAEAKTVLRFEVIFERAVPSVDVLTARYGHRQLEAYVVAAAKYGSAHGRVARGDREGFMREYQEVVALQAEASRAELAATVGRAAPAGCLVLPRVPGDEDGAAAAEAARRVLNPEALGEVLLFATDAEVVAVMCASRRAYYAVHTAPSWRERCVHHLPVGVHRAVEAQVPRGLRSHVPWVALYPRLRVLHRRFQPVGLLPLATGVLTSFVSGAPPDRALYRGVREYANVVRRRHSNTTLHAAPFVAADSDSATPDGSIDPMRTVEHFELASVFLRYPFDNPYHLNVPDVDRYRLQFAIKRRFLPPMLTRGGAAGNPPRSLQGGSIADVTGAGGRTEWSVLVACFAALYDPTWVPAIVVDAPSWTDVAAMRERTRQDLFECVRFSAVGHASIAECVAAKHAVVEGVPVDEVAVLCIVRFASDAESTVLRYAASSTSHSGQVFKIVFDDIENSADVKELLSDLQKSRQSGASPSGRLYFVDLGPVQPVAPGLDTTHVAPEFPSMNGGDDVVAAVVDIANQLGCSASPRFVDASFVMDGSVLVGLRPEFRQSCAWRVAW